MEFHYRREVILCLAEYTFEAMVCGYQVNHEIWNSTIGESSSYVREAENYQDPFAVAVDRLGVIIGHVPRRILFMCSMYALEMGWLYRLQNNFSYVLFCETFPKED